MSSCQTCKRELNTEDPSTKDCGGDCLKCMAEAGDPACIEAMNELVPETKLVEDVMGPLGFRVEWIYTPETASIKAYGIIARGDLADTPMFAAKGYKVSGAMATDIEHATVYLSGTVKPDGAATFEASSVEWTGEQDFIKHAMLLNYIWRMSRQLFAGLPHA